jgi:hypothetical protein
VLPLITETDKTKLRELIWKERRIELEGHRRKKYLFRMTHGNK